MKKIISMLICALILVSSVSVCFAEEAQAQYDNHDIIKEVAYAYHLQGGQIHYSQKWGMRGLTASPEDATSQRRLYLDCSSYVNASYLEAFGENILPYEITKVKPTTEFLTNYAKENPDNIDVIGYWETENYPTDEDKSELINSIIENFETGDIIVYRRKNKTSGSQSGHTLMYVGNDKILHCTGSDCSYYLGTTPEKSYDNKPAEDVTGAVLEVPVTEFANPISTLYLFRETETQININITVLRPLNRGLAPTQKTLNRMAISGLAMEKTASVYENSAVRDGDAITYTVTLENTTDSDIKGVTITDVIPAGTIGLSKTDSVTMDGANISWTSDVPAGKTVKVAYSVRVTEETPGFLIVSDKTTVSGVGLGKIVHTVSGLNGGDDYKLVTTAKKYASQEKAFESSLQAAKALYKDALGIDIFPENTVTDVINGVINHSNYTYEKQTELSKMLVPGLYGGCDLYTTVYAQLDGERTRLVSEGELSVGDILVGDIFPAGIWKGNFAGDVCYIYLGNSMLLTVADGKAITKTIGLDIYGKDADNILVSLPAYNRFAVIRPSMKYPESESIFTDVSNDAWYYDAVKYVKGNKIIDGIYAGTFSPDKEMTRADLVIALYRLAGSPEAEIVKFDDVLPYMSESVGPSETEKAISWAVNNGIATGVSETLFAPEASLTREQMAAFFYRYAKYKNADIEKSESTDISAYSDKDAISSYAVSAMKYAIAEGIISGVTDETLAPKGTLTRAQAAVMLQRLTK